MLNEQEMAEALCALIEEADGDEVGGFAMEVESARPFNDVGIMSANEGLVVNLADGSQFQVTVVQSRLADDEEA